MSPPPADESKVEMLALMDKMNTHYKHTLHNLLLIDNSVSSMISVVHSMNSTLQESLDWILTWLGGAKDGLHMLTTMATHAGFLFLGALLLAYVRAPGLTRVALLLLVSLNGLAEVRFHWSVGIGSLALLQALVLLGKRHFLQGNLPGWLGPMAQGVSETT